jgi:hypothetical protein
MVRCQLAHGPVEAAGMTREGRHFYFPEEMVDFILAHDSPSVWRAGTAEMPESVRLMTLIMLASLQKYGVAHKPKS